MERARAGLRVPMDLNTVLTLAAKRMGVSKNALMLQILRDWAKKNAIGDTEGKKHDVKRDSQL